MIKMFPLCSCKKKEEILRNTKIKKDIFHIKRQRKYGQYFKKTVLYISIFTFVYNIYK